MSRLLSMVLAVMGGSGVPLPTRAQDVPHSAAAPDTTTRSRRPICFRGGALPSCRTFGIVEVAYHLHDDPPGNGLNPYLSLGYGLMVNVTGHDAVGATIMLSGLWNSHNSFGRTRQLLRYRRWILQEGLAVDVSVGRGSTADDDPERRRYAAEVGVSLGDYIGVFGHAFGSPDGAHPSGGVKLGSWPALILQVASILALMSAG